MLVNFEEICVIHNAPDDVFDVVGQIRFRGNNRIERRVHASHWIGRRFARRIFAIVLRQVAQQFADQAQALGIIVRHKMAHAADGVVRHGAAQLFLGHIFVRHRLDYIGTGDKHVAGVFNHYHKIGDCRGINRAARARAHNGGNLRHNAACQRVAQKNIGITAQRQNAFLDPRAAGVIQADEGRPILERHIHHLASLLRVGFRQRAAEHRKILRENVSQTAVDASPAGDEAVARNHLVFHSEIAAAVRDQLVEFFEGIFVEQQLDALARGELSVLVLPLLARFAAALLGHGMAAPQFVEPVHQIDCSAPRRQWNRHSCLCARLLLLICDFQSSRLFPTSAVSLKTAAREVRLRSKSQAVQSGSAGGMADSCLIRLRSPMGLAFPPTHPFGSNLPSRAT